MKNHWLDERKQLEHAMLACSDYFKQSFLISFLLSLLSLTPMAYMLIIYSHVLLSRDAITLVSACGLVIGIYLVMEYIDLIRNKLLYHASLELDEKISQKIIEIICTDNSADDSLRYHAFNDLKTIRNFFISSPGTAVYDIPFVIILSFVVYLLSPILCAVVLIAVLVQVLFTVTVEKKIVPGLVTANRFAVDSKQFLKNIEPASPVIYSMGMRSNIYKKWHQLQKLFITEQAKASEAASEVAAAGKFTQLIQSSLLLGISCFLALHGELVGGEAMIIIASMLGGRVLAPVITITSNWNQILDVRESRKRLGQVLNNYEPQTHRMSLPTPDGAISVQGLYVKDHKSESFLLRNINFEVNPGEVLLVTGPSGAGKTSLLRAIIGINLVHSGNIRIDGFDSKAWNPDELGQHIGYVPQDIGLLDGTIAENIARFGDIDREYLSDACELAGLNQLVEMLPEGVATKIGSGARILSGGQRQLVALSRALYGSPKIFLLDEPNSGLDSFGAQKLMLAIEALKKKGCTTIIVSHRTSVLPLIDKILVLANGAVLSFGSKNDVLAKHQNTRKTQVVA